MQLKELHIDAAKTLGSKQILREPPKQRYEYRDGERTSNVLGTSYALVLPENGYAQIDVLVTGDKQIDPAKAVGNPAVIVEGASIGVSGFGDKIFIRATATGIRLAESENKAQH